MKEEGDGEGREGEEGRIKVEQEGGDGEEGGSPDSGGESAKLAELKGKSDAAKLEQLQRMMIKVGGSCSCFCSCFCFCPSPLLLLLLLLLQDSESIKELKGSLKKAQAELKERTLLLDMYKTCTKETRDKVLAPRNNKNLGIGKFDFLFISMCT